MNRNDFSTCGVMTTDVAVPQKFGFKKIAL